MAARVNPRIGMISSGRFLPRIIRGMNQMMIRTPSGMAENGAACELVNQPRIGKLVRGNPNQTRIHKSSFRKT
jgi:hypothetical protein